MKRLFIIKILLFISMFVLLSRLFFIQIIKNEYYVEKKKSLTERIIEGDTAPRGRIYDRNGVLLVDNKPNKVIYYKKYSSVNRTEELDIVSFLSSIIDVNYKKITSKIHKDYYLALNPNIKLITEEELELYENRQITYNDIMELKYSRISEEDLITIDKEEAYIYYLMNNGYSYEQKLIKS